MYMRFHMLLLRLLPFPWGQCDASGFYVSRRILTTHSQKGCTPCVQMKY
jgi:hypothetical protein